MDKHRLKPFNAFDLKLLMAVLMVLDHIDHIPHLLPPELAAFFHVITRCVGACFAYLAVEGFLHTHDRVRYNVRLFLWALIMAVGNQIYDILGAAKGLTLSNNVFFTLALGVLCLNVLADTSAGEWAPAPRWEKVLRILGTIAIVLFGALFAEGGIVLLPFILITYLFRGRKRVRDLLYLAFSILLFLLSYHPYSTLRDTLVMLAFNSDFLFITALPFLALYNGERGPKNKASKYFFYLFYPLHLWIIGAIALAVA